MITLKSHGFKFSRPEANFVFDVSYFKNPWRDEEIRNELNRDARKELVVSFMKNQAGVTPFVNNLASLLSVLDTTFEDENIVIALCCSAGEYRSPAMVEMVSKELFVRNVSHKIIHSPNSKI